MWTHISRIDENIYLGGLLEANVKYVTQMITEHKINFSQSEKCNSSKLIITFLFTQELILF